MAFPPLFRRPQPSPRKKSKDRERTDESTTRPNNPRRPSHISLHSDWTTCPPSSSLPSPKPIPKLTSIPPVPQNDSPLTSWITAPPSPPTSKEKMLEYVKYLSLPDLDQNIAYLLSHPEAIPEQLRTPCFQTAIKFLAHYVLPPSGVREESERGLWDFELERGELEDLMIVGARLGHEYALPSATRKRKSFLELATPFHDLCEETKGKEDDYSSTKSKNHNEGDENDEWLSKSYQNLLGDKDPFDLPICWGRPFGKDLFPRDDDEGPRGVDIQDEEYDALEGAYPDFKKDGEMSRFGGISGGDWSGVTYDVEDKVKKEVNKRSEKGSEERELVVEKSNNKVLAGGHE